MSTDRFDAVAAHIISSARHTTDYRDQFLDEHGTPPTLMAKVHHFRSVIQALLISDERYELASAYGDFGRVEFKELATEERYLLRSAGAFAIEKNNVDPLQSALFAIGQLLRPTAVQVLIYEFENRGVTLSVAPGVRRAGKSRVLVKSEPIKVGHWPLVGDIDEAAPFEQDQRDPFGDVGDLNEDDGEAGTS